MLKMDVFINLFLLFYVHILLGKLFMNVVKKKKKNLSSKTHVAFTELHQSICICIYFLVLSYDRRE